MPLYPYRCESCEHSFDELQRMSDEPLKICPKCKKPELKKLIGAANFVLKGSGFHVNDYPKIKGQ